MIENAIYAKVHNDGIAGPLLGGRIFFELIPPGNQFPCACITLVSSEPLIVHSGYTGRTRGTIQIDTYALVRKDCRDIAEKIRLAISDQAWTYQDTQVISVTAGNALSLPEGPFSGKTSPVYRLSGEFTVWFTQEMVPV